MFEELNTAENTDSNLFWKLIISNKRKTPVVYSDIIYKNILYSAEHVWDGFSEFFTDVFSCYKSQLSLQNNFYTPVEEFVARSKQ